MEHGQRNGVSSRVVPRGPVFVSYRQSDGTEIATNLAWALRSAGVPVWHDRSDLPPGDTERRLGEAVESGLSGAVLVVTPEIGASSVIRELELPRLLVLATESDFTFSIASVIEKQDGGLDYQAPDRLMSIPGASLSRLRQDAASSAGSIADIARDHCRRRMEALREEIVDAGRTIEINVQTRLSPSANQLHGDLVVRLRPPLLGERRPNRQGLEDLGRFLADLPYLLTIADARHARVSGGAHLSVAFALGAAMPTTLLGRVEVIDTAGHSWALTENAPASTISKRLIEITDRSPPERNSGHAFVYVDLLPSRSDYAFEQLLEAHRNRVAAAFHIRSAIEGNLRPADAAAIVAEVSHAIRQAASYSETSEVHVLLRCPWTVALLLGRTLNTVRVNLYEWEDGSDGEGNRVSPRYLPSLVVRSGAGGSPIENVVLPARTNASV